MNNDVPPATRCASSYKPIYAHVRKIDLIDEPLSIFDEAKRTTKWHEFGFRIRCLTYIFDGNIANRPLSGEFNIDAFDFRKNAINAIHFKLR